MQSQKLKTSFTTNKYLLKYTNSAKSKTNRHRMFGVMVELWQLQFGLYRIFINFPFLNKC